MPPADMPALRSKQNTVDEKAISGYSLAWESDYKVNNVYTDLLVSRSRPLSPVFILSTENKNDCKKFTTKVLSGF